MAATFEQAYRCLSFSYIGKSHLEDGNRVIMPQSAFVHLSKMEIEYPMLFEIKTCYSDHPRISHCGVLEFTAEEGMVFVPNWLIQNLKIQEGELVLIKNVALPKGSYMKIQPHKTKFINLPGDPKEILERSLKNYACVTAGDTIMISHECDQYYIDVIETKPYSNGISLVETDCEVDFAPPLDYKEPVKVPKPEAQKGLNDDHSTEERPKVFQAFTGEARRLNGLPVRVPVVKDSNDKSPKLQPGKLLFGSDRPSKVEEDEAKKFKPFTGKKRTLADSVATGGKKRKDRHK